jgi:hypothetical protein
VPDDDYHQSLPTTTWVPAAAVGVEVVSLDDENYQKFASDTRSRSVPDGLVEVGDSACRLLAVSTSGPPVGL